MGWKAEEKEYKNKKYSQYVVLCRKLKLEGKPFHAFEVEDLQQLKDKNPLGWKEVKNENRLRSSKF